jgi:hypothetical protein
MKGVYMNLKQLQEKYKKGELTKAQYLAAVAELLESKEIDQAAHDEAKDYDPNDPGEKLIYSQADVDAMAPKLAVKFLRKQLKTAGVEVDADNKTLLAKVVELAQAGTGKLPTPDEKDKLIADLQKQVGKGGADKSAVEKLRLENAVLKAVGKYNPVNAAQVVRALDDYKDLLEEGDDEGTFTAKSIDRALKRMTETEPNLFQSTDGENNDPNKFKGKPPGGPAGPLDKKAEGQKAEALAMLGIKTEGK